jgi:type IV pilus assembly protein PilB
MAAIAPAPLPGVTPASGAGRSTRLIGEVAVDLGFAAAPDVERAVETARRSGRLVGAVLVSEGILTARELSRVLAARFGLDHVELDLFPVDLDIASLVPAEFGRRMGVVAIGEDPDGTLMLATADPTNVQALDDLAMLTGRRVRPLVAAPEDVRGLAERLRPAGIARAAGQAPRPGAAAVPGPRVATAGAEDPPVVRLVDALLSRAVTAGASDVHVDPGEDDLRVTLRIDGELEEALRVASHLAPGVLARLKVLAELDIAERRAPQDGRATIHVDGRQVDLRIVTLPVVGGESAVIRVLDPRSAPASLAELGMGTSDLGRLVSALDRSHGGVLVCGPTGSGKTSTLYAALAHRMTGKHTIITIEDPVEYRLAGVKQMHVNPKAGVTFASGLRSIVRADPDVIMVGEIRDRETARMAVESALTGHLVLSTLHTRDAAGALPRLVEMGVEPFLLASAVDVVVAQRLVRRLCVACRTPTTLRAGVLRDHGFAAQDDVEAFEPVGCRECSGSGFRGRTGVFEVLALDDVLRPLVLERRPAAEIAAAAARRGMSRLADDGLEKLRAGVTSAAEVARVCGG